jgi:diaminopimelate epimerase
VENASYFPNRINMQLCKVMDRGHIRVEIYERGAGYTLASGTGACAAAAASHKLGLVDDRIEVTMPGGQLLIEIGEDGSVFLTGEVQKIGTILMAEHFLA